MIDAQLRAAIPEACEHIPDPVVKAGKGLILADRNCFPHIRDGVHGEIDISIKLFRNRSASYRRSANCASACGIEGRSARTPI